MDKGTPEVPFTRGGGPSTQTPEEFLNNKASLKSIVNAEMRDRKREALGLDRSYQVGEKAPGSVGVAVGVAKAGWSCATCTL